MLFFYVVLAQKLPESIKYGLELTDNSEILRILECTFFRFFFSIHFLYSFTSFSSVFMRPVDSKVHNARVCESIHPQPWCVFGH